MGLNIKPLGDRVVIKPSEDTSEKSPGGIILPDTTKEKPQVGEVIAVGPGRTTDDGKTIPLNVKVGDLVIHSKYSGSEYKKDGIEYLIVRESDLLAVV